MNNENTIIVKDEQGNTWLAQASSLTPVTHEKNEKIAMNDSYDQLIVPKPPKRFSWKPVAILAAIFVGGFFLVNLILNWPATSAAITYPLTHSEDSDNQKLTDEYRALYGYEEHPESNVLTPSPSPRVQEDFTLSIPKLNLSTPVQHVKSSADEDILAALKTGTVVFPGSVEPGESGTTVIVGHSSSLPPWTKYSAVFAGIANLKADDLIYISAGGKQYAYRVTQVKKGSVTEILDSGLTGDLVLSTCWPVGTDTNRVAVAAIRIQ